MVFLELCIYHSYQELIFALTFTDFSPGPNAHLPSDGTVNSAFHCSPLALVSLPDKPAGIGINPLSPVSHPACPLPDQSASVGTIPPSPLSHSPYPTIPPTLQPPDQPLLLSSETLSDPDSNHSSLVNKVRLALLPPPPLKDSKMDDPGGSEDGESLLGSEDSGSLFEPEDDMILSHYQKDIKLEALARRAPTKNKARSKKGRSSLAS